ncbi:MAG: hypothetical protein JXK16_02375 [Thiotrichales bacterium]|nr:hypothetical protein [Thiotrichales bacterium]
MLVPLSASSNEENAPTLPIEQLTGEALHVKLVEVTYQYDYLNKRCRGVSLSTMVQELNRLFLRKYGITVNNFVKLNIDRDTRGYKESVNQAFSEKLFELGGCPGASESNLVDTLKEQYRVLFENAQTSPWFPRT